MSNELFIELSAEQQEVVAGGDSLLDSTFFNRFQSAFNSLDTINVVSSSTADGSFSASSTSSALTSAFENINTDSSTSIDI